MKENIQTKTVMPISNVLVIAALLPFTSSTMSSNAALLCVNNYWSTYLKEPPFTMSQYRTYRRISNGKEIGFRTGKTSIADKFIGIPF